MSLKKKTVDDANVCVVLLLRLTVVERYIYSEIALTVIYQLRFQHHLVVMTAELIACTCCMIATVANCKCRLSVWNYTRIYTHSSQTYCIGLRIYTTRSPPKSPYA